MTLCIISTAFFGGIALNHMVLRVMIPTPIHLTRIRGSINSRFELKVSWGMDFKIRDVLLNSLNNMLNQMNCYWVEHHVVYYSMGPSRISIIKFGYSITSAHELFLNTHKKSLNQIIDILSRITSRLWFTSKSWGASKKKPTHPWLRTSVYEFMKSSLWSMNLQPSIMEW